MDTNANSINYAKGGKDDLKEGTTYLVKGLFPDAEEWKGCREYVGLVWKRNGTIFDCNGHLTQLTITDYVNVGGNHTKTPKVFTVEELGALIEGTVVFFLVDKWFWNVSVACDGGMLGVQGEGFATRREAIRDMIAVIGEYFTDYYDPPESD